MRSYPAIVAGLLGCLLMFLCLDLMRRLGEQLPNLSLLELAAATVILTTLLAGLCSALAAVVWGAQRLLGERGSELPILVLYLALYAINGAFFRLRFLSTGPGSFDPVTQKTIGLVFLGLCPLGYALLRTRLRELLDALEPVAPRLLRVFALLLVVSWVLPPLAGASRRLPPAEASGNVILVTFDTLSARNMSLYGYELPTTPNLDALARESVVFEQFHAISNMTLYCMPAFEGYYKQDGPSVGPTLSQVLAAAGFRTSMLTFWSPEFLGLPSIQESLVVRSWDDHPVHRLLRPAVGREALLWASAVFSEEPDYFHPFAWHAYDNRFWKREHFPAPLSYEAALDLLERRPEGNFLWVHLWAPHSPYLPSGAADGAFGGEDMTHLDWDFNSRAYEPSEEPLIRAFERRYDEYILGADQHFGEFVRHLRERGLLDNSLLVVSADHGESFTRGVLGHGGPSLHEALIHVPLLVRFPDGRGAGARPTVLCNQLDVAPTVLSALGLEVPPQLPGESLLPYVAEPGRLSSKPRFAISTTVFQSRRGQVAVLLDRYKLVYVLEQPSIFRFYDLLADPEEKGDASEQAPDYLKRMRTMLRLP